jgi:hypothetical protein
LKRGFESLMLSAEAEPALLAAKITEISKSAEAR